MRRPNHRVRHDLFAPWHGDRDSLVGACRNLQPKPSMKRKRPVETVVGNGQFRDAGGGTG